MTTKSSLYLKPFTPLVLILLLVTDVCRSQEILGKNISQFTRQVEALPEQFENLKSPTSLDNNRSLEMLSDLAEIYITRKDYNQAAQILTQILFIERVRSGLRSITILPILDRLTEIHLLLGRWEASINSLAHARFITTSNFGLHSEEALPIMERQANLRMIEFYSGYDKQEPEKVLQARRLLSDTALIAENLYKNKSEEAYPWHYKRALNLAELVRIIHSSQNILMSDFANGLIRRDGPMRFRGASRYSNIIGEGYLRQAHSHIQMIQDSAQAEGDEEAAALAEIYKGDFKVLSGRGSGKQQYDIARKHFLEAGIPREKIQELFATPTLIPLPKFFSRLDELLAYQRAQFKPNKLEGASPVLQITGDWHSKMRQFFNHDYRSALSQLGLALHDIELKVNISKLGKGTIQNIYGAHSVDPTNLRALSAKRFRPTYLKDKIHVVKDFNIRYSFLKNIR
ncbi:hypothetical protein N9D99_00070 [Gammaproteobacteria bacterium]|nr:hypothetical protein [Gammaproteobacteria bacterium]